MSIVDNLDDRYANILNEFIKYWNVNWVGLELGRARFPISLGNNYDRIRYNLPHTNNSLKNKEEVIYTRVDNLIKKLLLEQVDVSLRLINY